MYILRKIKHRFKMIFKTKYDNDIYCNYLHFYNMLFHNRIKDLKQMKKILIKMVEKSYNKTINENKPAMIIYDKERHDVELYWNEYFMRNVLQLKDIFDEPRKLCRQYRKEQRKYKDIDESIKSINDKTISYLQLMVGIDNIYYLYIIRILDVKIIIYYDMSNKRLYTKKYKIKGEKNNDKIH